MTEDESLPTEPTDVPLTSQDSAPEDSAPESWEQPLSVRTWRSLLMALGTMALVGWGVLHFADWIRERDEVLDLAQAPKVVPNPPPPISAEQVDPLLAAYMYPTAKYSRPRPTMFGKNRAWLLSGFTADAPNFVFARMIQSDDPAADEAAMRKALLRGPNTQLIMRAHAHAGAFEGGAFLVQLAPDLKAFRQGRFRMERGAVTLAFPGHSGWRYLTYYFPDGLDFDVMKPGDEATERSLDHLGPMARTYLDPKFVLDPLASGESLTARGGSSPLRTVLCRAKGTAAEAVEDVARELEAAGWRSLATTEPGDTATTRVLAGRDVQVWMTTQEPMQDGGMVSVMITPIDG